LKQGYVAETKESLKEKLTSAEKLINEESTKLYEKEKIRYEFDHYSGEIRLVFVKQTVFSGGILTHTMLQPMVKRLKEIDRKWQVGIMLRGASRVEDKTTTEVS
jgi:hypothetical protein